MKARFGQPRLLHPACPSCQCWRTTKTCPLCKQEFPLEQWRIKKDNQLAAYCVECERKKAPGYAAAKREKLKREHEELEQLRTEVKQLRDKVNGQDTI